MTHAGTVEGGCHCGAVRYRVDGPLRKPGHCHCTMCRLTSGAPVVTWTFTAPAHFHWSRGAPVRYASSPGCERTFCGVCGSKLTFTDATRPDDVDIATGSLDDPGAAPAQEHVYAATRLSWLALDPHLPTRGETAAAAAPACHPDGPHPGGCFCGEVRFEVSGLPVRSSMCHCGICRRETGGPFGAGGVWPRDRLVVRSGDTTAYPSSPGAYRRFCPTCGATVFYEDRTDPTVVEVSLALLDEPEANVPADHLFAADAAPVDHWVSLYARKSFSSRHNILLTLP